MSSFSDPRDTDRPQVLRCSCGRDHGAAAHEAEATVEATAASAAREQRERARRPDVQAV